MQAVCNVNVFERENGTLEGRSDELSDNNGFVDFDRGTIEGATFTVIPAVHRRLIVKE